MIDEKRALELYELALSVVEAKGAVVAVGLTPYREYRAGTLTKKPTSRSASSGNTSNTRGGNFRCRWVQTAGSLCVSPRP